MDLPRFNAIASDNYPPQTQWLDVLLGNNYKVISIRPLTRQIPNVREQRMWGLLSMDGCLLSRLLDTSSQVLGTIWRCLGKLGGHCGNTLWRQLFLFPVIPIIALTHTLLIGKQWQDGETVSSLSLKTSHWVVLGSWESKNSFFLQIIVKSINSAPGSNITWSVFYSSSPNQQVLQA